MKVTLIIYGSLETLTGGYLYDRQMVAALEKDGQQVEILSLPYRGYLHHLGDNFSNRLRNHIEASQPDILLEDELNHPSLFWLNNRLIRKAHFPILAVVHHLRSSERRPNWQNLFYRQIERRYLQSLDGCIYNSRTTRRAVEALAGQDIPGVIAFPGGDRLNPEIDGATIARRSRQPGSLRLVFVGSLIPRKGLHTLIDAIDQLPRGAVRLEVIGNPAADPVYARRMQQQAQTAGLMDEILFRGVLTDRELREVLAKSQALVLPSTYEGFGIAYLEAMGFGLPVIATTGGAASELISPGQQGFLIRPGDAAGLADCLQSWIADRALLESMSLAALRRYRAFPTWQETGEKISHFLRKIRAGEGAPGNDKY